MEELRPPIHCQPVDLEQTLTLTVTVLTTEVNYSTGHTDNTAIIVLVIMLINIFNTSTTLTTARGL